MREGGKEGRKLKLECPSLHAYAFLKFPESEK
jgi:hypothetical protein